MAQNRQEIRPRPRTARAGEVWLQDSPIGGDSRWLHFTDPLETLSAATFDRVPSLLERAEAATDEGLWAAGFLGYEAAPAFDPAMRVRPPAALPVAWFSIFEPPRVVDRIESEFTSEPGELSVERWEPTLEADEYDAAVRSILRRIEAGETYQVNFTLRLRGAFRGDPRSSFLDLLRHQRGRYGAWIDLGRQIVASASPELFFRLEGDRLIARPMKGTVARGRHADEDVARGAWLSGSAKNRAENLMIVDMIRNDLGRIARAGSVRVRSLFDLERYPSLFQLTSTVEARTDATACQIVAALFPCASITGAPKIRTMELIRDLESTPRGVYTGSIGYLAPQRRAQFNVAIRGVHFDLDRGTAEYGTGGGIVWDSSPEEESREWRTKALIVARPAPAFELLETMRWDADHGYALLDHHLDRLAASADYFDFPFSRPETLARLSSFAGDLKDGPLRVRLLLTESGEVALEADRLPPTEPPLRLAVSRSPVDSSDRFLFHKTTSRQIYEEARASRPQHDDVVLWNERGELTETSVANLVLELDGQRVTPPLDCGLLAGTLRSELLESGEIAERRLTLEDLDLADRIWAINSVRGWMPAVLDRETLPATLS